MASRPIEVLRKAMVLYNYISTTVGIRKLGTGFNSCKASKTFGDSKLLGADTRLPSTDASIFRNAHLAFLT